MKLAYNYTITALWYKQGKMHASSKRVHAEHVTVLLKFARFLGLAAWVTCHETGKMHVWDGEQLHIYA